MLHQKSAYLGFVLFFGDPAIGEEFVYVYDGRRRQQLDQAGTQTAAVGGSKRTRVTLCQRLINEKGDDFEQSQKSLQVENGQLIKLISNLADAYGKQIQVHDADTICKRLAASSR